MKNTMTTTRLKRTADLPTGDYVVLDTETTGLTPGKDEVLSIAIVDADGNELFYSLIKPLERKRWPNATEIHGITWKDVKDKPTIYDVGNEVSDILNSASLVIGYNTDFDLNMLRENGLPSISTPTYDLMDEYAQAYGNWSERKNDYLWIKLEQCANHYGYVFNAHNALEDAKATAYCFKKFQEECMEELPAAVIRDEQAAKMREEIEAQEAKQREEEAHKQSMRTIAIIAVIICLILGAVLSFIFNPTLFWGVIIVAAILIWILAKVFG